MGGFTDPTTLALLGASSGFLDPHGGMAAGFQGAMRGLQAGNDMKRQKELDALEAQKAQSKIDVQSWLKENIKPDESGKFDIRNAGNKMLATGHTELMGMGINLLKHAPKAKYQTVNNNGVMERQAEFDDGNIGASGGLPIAEKLMQIQQGNKTTLAGNMSGKPIAEYGQNMSPGEVARLEQSQQQFGASHGLAQQRLAQDRQTNIQPKFVDGNWVIPPNFNNPQGTIIPTSLSTAPKGSEAEKTNNSAKVSTTLGDDTEQLINQATGSLVGASRDMAASAFGVTTDPAKANATLKIRSATLAGNMPRFEGPQSDADRQYYLEMAGDLANPLKTTTEKLMALKELRRLHGLGDKPKGGVGGSNDGWGDLK